MTLGQHLQGKMTSSVQSFRHFWLSVQDYALADLAPKLKHIASGASTGVGFVASTSIVQRQVGTARI